MTTLEMYANLRELIGAPSKEEVSNQRLQANLIPALDWLAQKLRYLIKEDDYGIQLVASQIAYQLPSDLLWIIWVSWNSNRLTPSSQYRWDRDTENFRSAPASTPDEYAVQANQLLLLPPASASAIITAGYLKLRYIAGVSKLEAGGPVELFDSDCWLALWKAAIRYLIVRPSEENQARVQAYQEQINEALPMAIARNAEQSDSYWPGFAPEGAQQRLSAAR